MSNSQSSQRKLAAILSADVVGYSGLMQADEAATLTAVKRARLEIVEPAVALRGGRVFKAMGDGLLAEFVSVVAAVECALAIQSQMEAAATPSGPSTIRFRIGVNFGDVIVDDGDIYGDGVNTAARVQALAPVGGVAVSRAVREQLAGKLDCAFNDLGERRVKDHERAVHAFSICKGTEADDGPAVSPVGTEERKPSVAVLPFANLSPEPDQDYFADGMVEEIVTALSRYRSLFVIASGSSLSLKGKGLSPQEAAARLSVRYVLEGSVRRAGNRIRITAALIDVEKSRQIWTERFDDLLDDIFALQDRVALNVAARLVPAIEKNAHRGLGARPTTSLSSYELLLRAGPLLYAEGKDNIEAATQLVERAVSLDPDYARAVVMLASCYANRFIFEGSDARKRLREQILELTRRAVRLSPDDWAILASAAMAVFHTHRSKEDMGAAVTLADRALELNPGAAYSWNVSGWIRNAVGQPEVAIDHLQKALQLDPLSSGRHNVLEGIAIAKILLKQYSDAIPLLREATELSPMPETHLFLAQCYAGLGQLAEARVALNTFEGLIGAPADTLEWVRNNPAAMKAMNTIREAPELTTLNPMKSNPRNKEVG